MSAKKATAGRYTLRSDVLIVSICCTSLRYLVSLHGHSGQGIPPMYGDYEAQRHWMELTVNLPLSDWYSYDLSYWGLDYPPLTAYVSLLCGLVSRYFDPRSMELFTSRGYEREEHKVFMRATAIILDLLVYYTAAWACSRLLYPAKTDLKQSSRAVWCFLLVLMQPALVLIDHGHFQYNAVSLGLAIAGATACLQGAEVFGSIWFCLSLNFKQMSLYYAPVFFFYLLGRRVVRVRLCLHLLKLAAAVLGTFAVMWLPFCSYRPSLATMGDVGGGGDDGRSVGCDEDSWGCSCLASLQAVLVRLFPFSRGLFEDKVANFW